MSGIRHYTVHFPPVGAEEALDEEKAAERAVFVRDGFNWPCLFIPLIWLLYRRMWLVLVLYLALTLALVGLDFLAGDAAATWVAIAFAVFFAMEANNLRRWSLDRRGWREVGAASGRDEDEAALRFFAAEAAAEEEDPWGAPPGARRFPRRAAPPPPVPPRRADRDDPPVMGLFPEAGG